MFKKNKGEVLRIDCKIKDDRMNLHYSCRTSGRRIPWRIRIQIDEIVEFNREQEGRKQGTTYCE